ncbi:hypothetical protein BREVNS_0213 [Brevinematales bacterium NS]|nr:hypothetical protein BREVNS_0213 [Brevinematales bacterium NS]
MGQGLRSSPPLFLFPRAYLSFFIQKSRIIYYDKEYFYTIFIFLLLF